MSESEPLLEKLREQAHQMRSPYYTKPKDPDWEYVAKAFDEIADELAAALRALRAETVEKWRKKATELRAFLPDDALLDDDLVEAEVLAFCADELQAALDKHMGRER